MKVILIKDCSDGKANEIVDVKPGYANNYLIKNGLAEHYTENAVKKLEQRLIKLKEIAKLQLENSKEVKKQIEETFLEYELKSNNEHVHHAITSKKIVEDLNKKGVKLSKFDIPNLKINEIGETKVVVKLPQDISAKLRIIIKKAKE